MIQAMELNSMTRTALTMLVEVYERKTGSRETALVFTAREIGSSTAWVRKFIAQNPEASEPRITLWCNIANAYSKLCDRVEREHQIEMTKIAWLKGQLNAATEGFSPPLATQAGAKESGNGAER